MDRQFSKFRGFVAAALCATLCLSAREGLAKHEQPSARRTSTAAPRPAQSLKDWLKQRLEIENADAVALARVPMQGLDRYVIELLGTLPRSRVTRLNEALSS